MRVFFPSFVILNKQHLTGYANLVFSILNAEAPADSAKSSKYTKSRIAYSICDGRYKASEPRTSVAPPIQLFHPAFGYFLDGLKSSDALPDDIIVQTVEYMRAATAIYESEGERRQVLTPLLCAILGFNIQTIQNADKTTPDGMVEVMTDMLHFIILFQGEKNEFGEGGSDPSTQAGLSVARSWVQSKVCRNLLY